ncbi:MAG: hypothetical protein LBR52_06015 [Prevotellaceae bacterium]|jgi:uncharacterized coiled-coil DUF342 family protein|nr:hypothetical protein [Prevotellaceae bacterium]
MRNLNHSYKLIPKISGKCSFSGFGERRKRFSSRTRLVSILLLFFCQAVFPQTQQQEEAAKQAIVAGVNNYNQLRNDVENMKKIFDLLDQAGAFDRLDENVVNNPEIANKLNDLKNFLNSLQNKQQIRDAINNLLNELNRDAINLEEIQRLTGIVNGYKDQLAQIKNKVDEVKNTFNNVKNNLGNIGEDAQQYFNNITDGFAKFGGSLQGLKDIINGGEPTGEKHSVKEAIEQFNTLKKSTLEIISGIEGLGGEINDEARNAIQAGKDLLAALKNTELSLESIENLSNTAEQKFNEFVNSSDLSQSISDLAAKVESFGTIAERAETMVRNIIEHGIAETSAIGNNAENSIESLRAYGEDMGEEAKKLYNAVVDIVENVRNAEAKENVSIQDGANAVNDLKEKAARLKESIQGLPGGVTGEFENLNSTFQSLCNEFSKAEPSLDAIKTISENIAGIIKQLEEEDKLTGSMSALTESVKASGESIVNAVEVYKAVANGNFDWEEIIIEAATLAGFSKQFYAPVGFQGGYGKTSIRLTIEEMRSHRTTTGIAPDDHGENNYIAYDARAEFQLPFSSYDNSGVTKLTFKGNDIIFSGRKGGEEGPDMTKLTMHFGNDNQKVDSIPMFNRKVYLVPDTSKSYVGIDCNGFRELSLAGEFVFMNSIAIDRNGDDLIKPNEENDQIMDTTKVSAHFSLFATDLDDMIVKVEFPNSFKLDFTGDFIYTVHDALLDLSTVRNAEGFAFPTNYSTDFGDDGDDLWTGFALKELSVKFPPDLSGQQENDDAAEPDPIEINVKNVLFDEYGFTGEFFASLGEDGKIVNSKSMVVSIDQVGMSILKSKFESGFLKGNVEIKAAQDPEKEDAENNNWNIDLDGRFYYQKKTGFEMEARAALGADKQLNIPFTENAQLVLKQGCSLSFTNKNEDKINYAEDGITPVDTVKVKRGAVELVLNGYVTFKTSFVRLDELRFENLTISSRKPYLRDGNFALAGSADYTIGGLRMALNSLGAGYDKKTDLAYFTAEMTVELIGDGLGASVGGKFKFLSDVAHDWEIKGLSLDKIAVDIDFSVFALKGSIEKYGDPIPDPIYGRGLKGDIALTIKPIDISASAEFRFGKTLDEYVRKGSEGVGGILLPDSEQGSFRYWFGVIEASFGSGILIFPPSVNLQSIKGGLFSKMSQVRGKSVRNGDKLMVPDYIPDNETSLGFIVGVGLNVANENLVIINAELEIAFASGGGLSYMTIRGLLNMLGKDKESSLLNGFVNMEYNHIQKIFHMDAGVNVDTKLLTGQAKIVLHTDPDEWWFHVGSNTEPVRLKFIDLAEGQTYFMLGKMPSYIEPLDKNLITEFGFHGYNAGSPADAKAGRGLAFGLKMTVDVGFDKFIYAFVELSGGTDGYVLYKEEETCQPGGSHYRAGVNAFFYLGAGAGVKVRSKRFEVVEFSVLAGLQAEIPKPYYVSGGISFKYKVLGGLVKGNANTKFEGGKTCDWAPACSDGSGMCFE